MEFYMGFWLFVYYVQVAGAQCCGNLGVPILILTCFGFDYLKYVTDSVRDGSVNCCAHFLNFCGRN